MVNGYLMGPAKSTPTSSNAAPTAVRSLGSGSGAGAVTGVAVNLLQP